MSPSNVPSALGARLRALRESKESDKSSLDGYERDLFDAFDAALDTADETRASTG